MDSRNRNVVVLNTAPGADSAFWKGGVKSLGKGWAPSELVREAGGAGGQSPPGENFEGLALRMSVLKC